MKKIFIRIGIVTVLLVIAVLLIGFFSLNSLVVKGVNTLGPRIMGVDVRLGGADLSPFSGSGKLSKLFVGNPEGYKTTSAIKVGEIKVGLQIKSVLSSVILVDEVDIQAPEITLEVGLTGKNNLSAILNNLGSGSGDKGIVAQKKAAGMQKKITVKDLVVAGGIVNVSSPMLQGRSVTVPLPPLHLQNIGTDGGVSIEQFIMQILKPVLESSIDAGLKGLSNVPGELQNLGKGGVDQLKQTGQGIGNLFKK